MPISISNDTYGYFSLANDIFNPNVSVERSVGYPLFLKFFGLGYLDDLRLIILMQTILSISIPLIVFKTLENFSLTLATLGGLSCCFYLYNYIISLYLITECFYTFSIALFAYSLVNYFNKPSVNKILLVIFCCWLIAFIRMSGMLYFLSFLLGIIIAIVSAAYSKDNLKLKEMIRHFVVAVIIYLSTSLLHSFSTDRKSSLAWPHFVFNWVYKSAEVAPIYLGIIHPGNGPKSKELFSAIETSVSKNSWAFDTLKNGATEKIKNLKTSENDLYTRQDVLLLMNDLIYNNKHDTRSWLIEGVLRNSGYGHKGTSELLKGAIFEAFLKNPITLWERFKIVINLRVWSYLTDGIRGNIVMLPTAYFHQIPDAKNLTSANPALTKNIFSQYAYDLFNHTGFKSENMKYNYKFQYPINLDQLQENIKSDNLIGFGHYLTVKGMQIIRVFWVFIIFGIILFFFINNKPLIASLLSSSIIPPLANVFISETDPRHLVMSSPIQIIAGCLIAYYIFKRFNKFRF